MQIEPRLREDISEMSALIYKPAINYHFNETCAFSFGYKYVDKYQKSDEHDLWQETHLNRKFGDLVSGFQIRLEERFSDEFSGVIPRLRLLQHVSHPLGETIDLSALIATLPFARLYRSSSSMSAMFEVTAALGAVVDVLALIGHGTSLTGRY